MARADSAGLKRARTRPRVRTCGHAGVGKSKPTRKKIEMLFTHLKRQFGFDRLRLSTSDLPVTCSSAPQPFTTSNDSHGSHPRISAPPTSLLIRSRGFGPTTLSGELGIDVLQANGAARALEILAGDPQIAVLAMPGMNGFELAGEALKTKVGLPILLIAGYADFTKPGQRPVAFPLLKKPFELDQLDSALKGLLRAGKR